MLNIIWHLGIANQNMRYLICQDGSDPENGQYEILGSMQSKRNFYSLLVEMRNCTSFWKTVWWPLTKFNVFHHITQQQSFRYLPSRYEKLCLYQNVHVNIYSSFVNICQKLEAEKMSFNRGRDNCSASIRWNIIQ